MTTEIGTRIFLEIPRSVPISPQSVLEYLKKVAGFVRHDIVVILDNSTTVIRSPLATGDLSKEHSAESIVSLPVGLSLHSVSPQDEVAIRNNCDLISFSLRSSAGEYEGHYSALVPHRPDMVSETGINGLRFSDGSICYPHTFVDRTGVALFQKGIGVDGNTHVHEAIRSHHKWLGPKLLVNVLDPSLLLPNLARTEVSIVDTHWLTELSSEVASRVLPRFAGDLASDPHRRALAIGSALNFCGIPPEHVGSWVGPGGWPVLLLQSGVGFTWSTLSEVLQASEILEIPNELTYNLRYALNSFNSGNYARLSCWRDEPAIATHWVGLESETLWHRGVVDHVDTLLRVNGYAPTTIRLVESPAAGEVPLVCRVWTQAPTELAQASTIEMARRWLTTRTTPTPRLLDFLFARSFYPGDPHPSCPELLEFPKEIASVAAIGSRCWNVQHPAVTRIVSALVRLALLVLQNEIPASLGRELAAYSIKYDWISPTRVASRRSAIEWHTGLLEVAKAAGVGGDAVPLTEADFLPHTIGQPSSLYRYDVARWA